MASWRDEILKEFTPQVARLTLIADPDGLLLEEGVLQGIRERGFEIIALEDHVAFRFAYESKYRVLWDTGELTDLVVVLRSGAAELRSLPYDLFQAGRKLSFSLPQSRKKESGVEPPHSKKSRPSGLGQTLSCRQKPFADPLSMKPNAHRFSLCSHALLSSSTSFFRIRIPTPGLGCGLRLW
jgi:hypothetical protein